MTDHDLLILSSGVNLGVMFMLAVHFGGQILDDRRLRKQLAAKQATASPKDAVAAGADGGSLRDRCLRVASRRLIEQTPLTLVCNIEDAQSAVIDTVDAVLAEAGLGFTDLYANPALYEKGRP